MASEVESSKSFSFGGVFRKRSFFLGNAFKKRDDKRSISASMAFDFRDRTA